MLQKPVWRPYFRLDMGYVYVQNFKVMDVSILSDQIATGTYQEVMFVQKGMLLSPSIGIQRIINDNFLKINFCLQFNYCFNGIDNEATKMNFNGEYPIINITADPTHFMSFHVGLIINLGSKRP